MSKRISIHIPLLRLKAYQIRYVFSTQNRTAADMRFHDIPPSGSYNPYALTRQNREGSTCKSFLPPAQERQQSSLVPPARTTRRLSHGYPKTHSPSTLCGYYMKKHPICQLSFRSSWGRRHNSQMHPGTVQSHPCPYRPRSIPPNIVDPKED